MRSSNPRRRPGPARRDAQADGAGYGRRRCRTGENCAARREPQSRSRSRRSEAHQEGIDGLDKVVELTMLHLWSFDRIALDRGVVRMTLHRTSWYVYFWYAAPIFGLIAAIGLYCGLFEPLVRRLDGRGRPLWRRRPQQTAAPFVGRSQSLAGRLLARPGVPCRCGNRAYSRRHGQPCMARLRRHLPASRAQVLRGQRTGQAERLVHRCGFLERMEARG